MENGRGAQKRQDIYEKFSFMTILMYGKGNIRKVSSYFASCCLLSRYTIPSVILYEEHNITYYSSLVDLLSYL